MIPAEFMPQVVQLEAYQGGGAYGDVFADAVSVGCYVERSATMVRNGEGEEVLASGVIFCNRGVEFPPGSRVTVGGWTTYVITVAEFDDDGITGLDHIEVAVK